MGRDKSPLRLVRIARDTDRDYFKELHGLLDQIYDIATDNHKWTWGRLAREAGIATETVNRLGDRLTKFPHLRTVIRLAQAVGLNIRLTPSVASVPHKTNNRKKKKVG